MMATIGWLRSNRDIVNSLADLLVTTTDTPVSTSQFSPVFSKLFSFSPRNLCARKKNRNISSRDNENYNTIS